MVFRLGIIKYIGLFSLLLYVLMELNPDITSPDAVISYGRLIRIR